MTSKPDQYSPLNGHDLIAKKVKLIVWMDMMYNFGCAQHDTDDWLGPDTGCRGSAQAAVMGWPSTVKQIFSPVGGDVTHGSWLSGCAAYGNPVRQAFEDWLGPSRGRSSWDPIAVMIATLGADAIYCQELDRGGHNNVSYSGKETWIPGNSSNQSRIGYIGSGAQAAISFKLNELLCKPPGPWTNTTVGWDLASGENCYGPRNGLPSHGATDLEHPPSASCGQMTLEACQEKCLELPQCTAITVRKNAQGLYECFRKADISLEHCDSGTVFDTYVRRPWYLAGGFNCYTGHGAKDLEQPPGSDCGTISLRQCQGKCAETPGCSAVVWLGSDHSGTGKCFRRADVELSKCDQGSVFDTYIHATPF